MKKLQKEKLKGILGIALIVVAVTGMFLWETVLEEKLTYKQIFVAAEEIEVNTEITNDMLKIISVPKNQVLNDRIVDSGELVGLITKIAIPQNTQIYKGMLSKKAVNAGKSEYICAIPKEWICAYPDTLRRGDEVFFYSVTDSNLALDYGEGIPSTLSNAEMIISTKVAYVKDASNQEVINVSGSRLTGSANIEKIEVLMDKDKYTKLESVVASGKKIVLMYGEGAF